MTLIGVANYLSSGFIASRFMAHLLMCGRFLTNYCVLFSTMRGMRLDQNWHLKNAITKDPPLNHHQQNGQVVAEQVIYVTRLRDHKIKLCDCPEAIKKPILTDVLMPTLE